GGGCSGTPWARLRATARGAAHGPRGTREDRLQTDRAYHDDRSCAHAVRGARVQRRHATSSLPACRRAATPRRRSPSATPGGQLLLRSSGCGALSSASLLPSAAESVEDSLWRTCASRLSMRAACAMLSSGTKVSSGA